MDEHKHEYQWHDVGDHSPERWQDRAGNWNIISGWHGGYRTCVCGLIERVGADPGRTERQAAWDAANEAERARKAAIARERRLARKQ